jgi:hypothetical protein
MIVSLNVDIYDWLCLFEENRRVVVKSDPPELFRRRVVGLLLCEDNLVLAFVLDKELNLILA